MKWFLIDSDDGIIDEAEKKAILMWRNRFRVAHKVGKGYIVDRDNSNGIGGNYHIIKECDMKSEGFEWALDDYKGE